MRFTSSVRDAVYGTIPITALEQEVMRLPMLGRLKNIKELGLAYLAFPGANHSRFEHSVGAMHVAYLMGQSVGLEDAEMQAVRLAALLHDVGHPPFSHSVGFAFELSGIANAPSHVAVSRQKIAKDAGLKRIISSYIPLLHQEDLSLLATGGFRDRLMSKIIDGPLDSDKIDYILRDNYHCGLPVALDINTITETFAAVQGREIALREPGMSFAEQLFVGRYHLITKIHHNRINREANYLLALALNESMGKTPETTAREELTTKMYNDWTDSDLITHLTNSSDTFYPLLTKLMLGEELLPEIGVFGYYDLSPLGRYNVFILSEHLSSLPSVSKKMQEETNKKKLFLDAYTAKPPETTLPVDIKPQVFLIDAPLTKGAIDASLEQVNFSVYSTEKLKSSDFNYTKIVTEFQRNLDPSLTKEKADGLIAQWASAEGKLTSFLLRHLVEIVANVETILIRQKDVIPSDLLLLILNSLYTSFMKTFQKRVYIDSLRELATIYNEMLQSHVLVIDGEQPTNAYKIEKTIEGFDFPTNFIVDLERLERYGLIHRFTRAIKAGERFTQKHQLRITGWGRAYYQRNLSLIPRLANLDKAMESFFDSKVVPAKAAYQEYFERLNIAEQEHGAEADVVKRRKNLPIRVSY